MENRPVGVAALGDPHLKEIAKIYIIGGQNEITRRNKKNKRRKRKELDLRVNLKANTREKHILVCHGTGCTSSKSPKIIENFRKIIDEKGIKNVRVIQTGCFGLCAKGPIVIIRPEDTFYAMVKPEDCEEIINTHILEGKTVERLLCKDINNSVVQRLDELTFYKNKKELH